MPTTLISGASAGIGRALAHVAASDGHDVVLVARRRARLESLADDLRSELGVRARVEPCDLADGAQRDALYERLEAAGVRVDCLVNNAGFGSTGAFHELDRSGELGQIEVNIAALTDLTRLFLPGMVERNRGRVLNIASTAAFQPGPYMAVYFATKAYVRSFSEALSYELQGTRITVTAHCPGPTWSEFGEKSGNRENLLFTRAKGIATAEEVARHAWAAAARGERVAVHGFTNRLGASIIPYLPRRLVLWAAAKLNRPA